MNWLPVAVIVMTTVCCYGQYCPSQLPLTVQRDLRLNSTLQLARLYPYGPKQCAKECLKRTSCKSINYDRDQMTCELNKVTTSCGVDLVSDKQYDFYDIRVWPKEMAGVCMDHGCPENTKCVPNHNGQISCQVSECDNPILIPNTTIVSGSIELGGSIEYQCKDTNVKITVKCGKDGQWKYNYSLSCNGASNVNKKCVGEYSSCFLVVSQSKTYNEANAYCKSYNTGGIAFIDSKATQQMHMKEYVKVGSMNSNNIWIHGKQNAQGEWRGKKNKEITYFNWAPSLNNSGRCLILNVQSGYWSTANCNSNYPFICEKSFK